MKSNAPGQLLGYSLQFPRALCRLLQIDPGGSVGVEVLGDVSSFFPEGITLLEEDKSSLVGNPLTDRSTDLWKTFYNWTNAALDKEIDLNKTKFVLYCNQSGREAIVNKFHSASSSQEAADAITYAIKELRDISDGHAIWVYFDFVANNNSDIFKKIIEHFELVIGKDAGYNEVKVELKKKLVPEYYIDLLINYLGGWLQKHLNEKFAKSEPAIVSFEEFSNQFSALFTKLRQRTLIDFASNNPPGFDEVQGHVKVRPIYIKQMDLINLPEDDIIAAVSDYLRADINRSKWIEAEILDETTAHDFEGKLKSFWENTRRKIELVNRDLKEDERGKILLGDCQMRQETIGDMSPPDRTIQGTYHTLADRKDVGWHPRWENLINGEGENNGSNS